MYASQSEGKSRHALIFTCFLLNSVILQLSLL